MKILQVVPFFSPVHGGSSLVPYNLSKELAKRGYEVTVYTSDYKLSGEWIESLPRVKVYPLKTRSIWANFYITEGLINHIRKEIKDFDIIHLHNYRTFQNVVVHHYAKKYGVPYILQAHGSLPRISAWRKLKWIYDAFFGYRLLSDASTVIALNEVEAQQYRSMGVPDEKIAVIPNGIDLSEYAVLPPRGSFKRKFDIPDRKKIVLYLGRIHKTKGVDLLVKAYAYIIKEMKYIDALLVIAGPDDGYLNEVKSLVASLGISNSVLFTGFISSEDKLSALVDADVFVTPSFYGFPVTFLEACATGTPIVTTTLGDTLEWIKGNVGYVVQPKTECLARAVYRLIIDEKLHKILSRNSQNIVKTNFSIEKVIDKLEQLYNGVVN
jgi:glycosyltransferase involved in cell wall biosynthesis